MIFAKADSDHNVLSVFHVKDVDRLFMRPLEGGEYFAPITHEEMNAFIGNPKASFIDGVFTIDPIRPVEPSTPTLDELKSAKIKELDIYTKRFIYFKNGLPRYTRDKQRIMLFLSSRNERRIRRSTLPEDVKAFLDGTSTISLSRANAWILNFMDRNEVGQDVRDQYVIIKSQYQSGTLTLKQVAEWGKSLLADIMEQHESILDQIESVFKWINSVLDAHNACKAAIESATNDGDLDAVILDFSVLDASDPGVSI